MSRARNRAQGDEAARRESLRATADARSRSASAQAAPGRASLAASPLTFALVVAVAVLTWIAFVPALDGRWLDWDDAELLTGHEAWRGLSARHFAWMFTTFHMGPYQPLSWLTYALDHAAWGMDPRGYHLTNLALHAATAVALFFLAWILFTSVLERNARGDERTAARPSPELEIGAALAALAWSLHPLRVESVAWITERRDSLSGFFLVVSVAVWLLHLRNGVERGARYWIAVIAFALSLLAKGIAVMLPAVLLVLDAWPLDRARGVDGRSRWRALVLEKWPFLALSAAAAIVAVVGQQVTGAVVKVEHHGLAARVVQAFYGLAFYVRKTLWPSELMALYPMKVPLDAGEMRFVLSIAAVVASAVALFALRRRAPALAVGFLCYALLVAPVLGLVQTGSQLVADRYSHQCGMALALLAGGGALWTLRRASDRRVALGALVAIGVVVLTPLAIATHRRAADWHDTERLFRRDLELAPDDAPGRRILLGSYLESGRKATDPAERRRLFEAGLAEHRRGLQFVADPTSMWMAARILEQMGGDDAEHRTALFEEALREALTSIELMERTVQRKPELYECAGVLLCELGRAEEAIPWLARAIAVDPRSEMRQGLYAEALMQHDRWDEARASLEHAITLLPEATALWIELAEARRHLGDRAGSLAAYRRFLELRVATLGQAAATDEDCANARAAIEALEKPN